LILTAPEAEALLLSLKVSAVAVFCSLPFAVAVALALANRNFRGKALVDGLLHVPIVLPPVVVGYLLLLVFGTRAPIGGWLLHELGIRFVFDWKGAALAAALLTFPFQVRAIRAAMEAIDPRLRDAARTLGAGWLDSLRNLILPLALPGIVGGAITAFAVSLGEFGAIITFASDIPGETRTLPLAIYAALQSPGGEAAAARLSAMSIVLAVLGLALAEVATRRARQITGP
jgi:molybdate transport system permease protein